MKVLLASIDSKYIHSNLAVRSLKKYAEQKLRESGAFCDIEIAEYTINQQPAKVMADIYKQDANVIMFSCYIWNRAFMEKLLNDLAVVRSDVDIWLGGPEVSFDSKEILVRFSNVRGIMTGEGEETLAKLLSAYAAADESTDYSVDNFNSVSGIIYSSSAEAIVCTPQREPLDMDQLPFVYEDLSDFENRIIYYESSRGCPFRCSYCLSSVDKKLRFRSLDQVKKELKFFLDNN
ncbi:MAG: cobalamin-dependent protein, partial [Firmicutes bacterium]|nr:cobalamin-dependent protein [Bacillota bacterium]